MTKRAFVYPALLLLLALAFSGLFYSGPEKGEDSSLVLADQVSEVEEDSQEPWIDEPLGLEEEILEQHSSNGTAKRIVEVPDSIAVSANDDLFTSLDAVEEHELEAFTRHNLERGLAGDLASANRVIHAQRRCQSAPRTTLDVENLVSNQLRRYERARSNGSTRSYPDESELRSRYMGRYESCQFQDSLFTQGLLEQLEGLANGGNVTARYLYSLLPPSTFGRSDAFLVQQEWSEKALSYSLANLTEGETAGLLAFGQSYANTGLFTTSDRYLGTSFIIAAINCGLDLEYYQSYVNRFLNSDRYAGPRSEVLVMADGLRTFCG